MQFFVTKLQKLFSVSESFNKHTVYWYKSVHRRSPTYARLSQWLNYATKCIFFIERFYSTKKEIVQCYINQIIIRCSTVYTGSFKHKITSSWIVRCIFPWLIIFLHGVEPDWGGANGIEWYFEVGCFFSASMWSIIGWWSEVLKK